MEDKDHVSITEILVTCKVLSVHSPTLLGWLWNLYPLSHVTLYKKAFTRKPGLSFQCVGHTSQG
jgi:hypothetical protein